MASLAIAADTIDWEAPVLGIQFTSRPREHALGGPSHSGISGVGKLDSVYNAPARVLEELADEEKEGVGHEADALSAWKFDPSSYAIVNCWDENAGVEDGDAGMC